MYESDPERRDTDRAILLITDDNHAGSGLMGYETEGPAGRDMLLFVRKTLYSGAQWS